MSAEPLLLPPGFGLRRAAITPSAALEDLLHRVIIFEPPRPREGHRYVLGVDVAEGVGADRSVIEVIRVGTLKEPDEEVATFVSGSTDPTELAHVVDTMGRLYADSSATPALVAIECNGFGLATQSELLRHIGYQELFVWQYEDVRDPRSRFSRTYGWYTTRKTRPIIMARFLKAIRSFALDSMPEFVFHNPFLIEELRDLGTEDGDPLWAAQALGAGHDDVCMACAIAVHVAQTLHFEDQGETLHETRLRMAQEASAQRRQAERIAQKRDFQNTAATAREMAEDLSGEVAEIAESFGEGDEWAGLYS